MRVRVRVRVRVKGESEVLVAPAAAWRGAGLAARDRCWGWGAGDGALGRALEKAAGVRDEGRMWEGCGARLQWWLRQWLGVAAGACSPSPPRP